ncbi:MAG: methylamine utilization protein MauG [Candidatus Tectomicrobia bacterium]|nr:methylamine utilization protein MauG [Candidatus Tectomicrobia bacterium]
MIHTLLKTRRRALTLLMAVALLAVPPLSANEKLTPNGDAPTQHEQTALARIADPPLGLPDVPVPDDNTPTAAKISLGRKLFFDERLSQSGELSCGSCHLPHEGFTVNERATPVGHDGMILRRNAPTLLNVAYQRSLFLDGRQSSLEKQALEPFTMEDELANPSLDVVIDRIRQLHDYAGLFEKAFGEGPNLRTLAHAISTYERTLLAADSAFDRWRFGGQEDALDAVAKQGFDLFTGKAGCVDCHAFDEREALFTDHLFRDDGVGWIPSRDIDAGRLVPRRGSPIYTAVNDADAAATPSDMGRMEITKDFVDMFRYRTPSLRNVELTAPYMHNGIFETLEDVVAYYGEGGFRHFGIDPLVRKLDLDEAEKAALVAFLKSLTAGNIEALIVEALIVEARKEGTPEP